ncbi:MAG: CobW family GTP-binding protein [Bacillota bacterium]
MFKVPVFILSGFLGSGKTTLLKRLLQECVGKKLTTAVLMNEIGKTDTDGESIYELNKSRNMEKLLDGCMCCNKKSEVVQCIKKLLNRKPDVIFIELTGVANPEEVVDSLTEPELINQIYLEKVITVVDAENFLSYNSLFESDRELVKTNRRQLEVADLLIVNKIDLVSESKKQKIKKLLKKENPSSEIIFSTYSKVDLCALFDNLKSNQYRLRIGRKDEKQDQKAHTHSPSFSRIKSITLPISSQTSTQEIERFLTKWKSNLLRAKGYLSLSDGTYLMQHVIKRVNWEPSNYSGNHYLVMIGINLNEKEIKQDWEYIAQKSSAL